MHLPSLNLLDLCLQLGSLLYQAWKKKHGLCQVSATRNVAVRSAREKGRKRDKNVKGRRSWGLCMRMSACMIQVTGASAENDSPPVGCTYGTCLHWSRGLHTAVCECARRPAATLYHTSAFHEFVHTHCCVRFALHVCVLTVILCDRMITPFSPQLRGTSQLRSLSSIDPREGMCIHMYVNACFLWAAPLLCISVSSPPFPRLPT